MPLAFQANAFLSSPPANENNVPEENSLYARRGGSADPVNLRSGVSSGGLNVADSAAPPIPKRFPSLMVTAVIPTVGVPLILNRSVVVSATETVSAAPPSYLIKPLPIF